MEIRSDRFKIVISIEVVPLDSNEELDEATKKVKDTFKGELVAIGADPNKPMKRKGNFSGAISAIAKASTKEEMDEIMELIEQREWTEEEYKTIIKAFEDKLSFLGLV